MIDVRPDQLKEVSDIIFSRLPKARVYVFGSRILGTSKPSSDLDLAIDNAQPLSLQERTALQESFEESSLPFRVDFHDYATTDPHFQNIIQQNFQLLVK